MKKLFCSKISHNPYKEEMITEIIERVFQIDGYFTLYELLESGVDWSSTFLNTIEKMKHVDPDPSNVRCVFFFDN